MVDLKGLIYLDVYVMVCKYPCGTLQTLQNSPNIVLRRV